jgi:hypothetical protein
MLYLIQFLSKFQLYITQPDKRTTVNAIRLYFRIHILWEKEKKSQHIALYYFIFYNKYCRIMY